MLIKARLYPEQIVANSVLFFEAAYETLSSSLGFITHLLVQHPSVQERLSEELTKFLESHVSLDYEAFSELKYLDAVIHEALRIFPPQTTFIGRYVMFVQIK
jgi:cytochrome P450 family 3 subfamily A